MWRPERDITGPSAPSIEDVSTLNRVFSEAFTDRYRRDGLVGVRVPQLNPDIWRYAIRDAGSGAMAWHDADHEMVAFNIAHRSGREGWMGPLAVRTDRQGEGIGRLIVETAIAWLKEQRVTTIGLETMPRTVDNIGFYGRLGFLPKQLTVTMTHDVGRGVAGKFVLFGASDSDRRSELLVACRNRLQAAMPGYDFSREIEMTSELGIGDTVVLEDGGDVLGFALYHAAPLADVRPADELRVLKLFAESGGAFSRLLVVLESCAAARRLRRVAVRCQTAYSGAYRQLVERGYRVRWTDLRMTLDGWPETVPPEGHIMFSNWEI
jgi:GNAT superfamily N-acetyltransferase